VHRGARGRGCQHLRTCVEFAPAPTTRSASPVGTFVRREDAERFIEEVRGDDPEVAAKLRIEERELEAGGLN